MRRNGLSAMLKRYLRHCAVHKGKERLLDDDIEPAALLAGDLDFQCEGLHHSIGDKDTGEGANECRSNEVTQNFRSFIKSPIALITPSTAAMIPIVRRQSF
jgi:hypothetical protein